MQSNTNTCRELVLYRGDNTPKPKFYSVPRLNVFHRGERASEFLGYALHVPIDGNFRLRNQDRFISYDIGCHPTAYHIRHCEIARNSGEVVERAWHECDGSSHSFNVALHRNCEPEKVMNATNEGTVVPLNAVRLYDINDADLQARFGDFVRQMAKWDRERRAQRLDTHMALRSTGVICMPCRAWARY
ncbi:hypothetical protein C8R43DRAFT_961109 [Mycena crocata]|nr:hypothetical protein C8R43DRAFT_961109 [Mycena crocata]